MTRRKDSDPFSSGLARVFATLAGKPAAEHNMVL